MVGQIPQHAAPKLTCLVVSSGWSCPFGTICPGRLPTAWLVSRLFSYNVQMGVGGSSCSIRPGTPLPRVVSAWWGYIIYFDLCKPGWLKHGGLSSPYVWKEERRVQHHQLSPDLQLSKQPVAPIRYQLDGLSLSVSMAFWWYHLIPHLITLHNSCPYSDVFTP